MAGQYGNVRITTQNLTVIKLIENDNLILVEGSVPGSKNGIVMLKDALKCKIPETAPFPAGLYSDNKVANPKKDDSITDNEVISPNLENDGGKVEN
jgi:large subunit ribosomal protein L3